MGPVVFSEILYRPAPGLAEFVELVNISGQPVALDPAAWPDAAWRLSGAVQYELPRGALLSPCVPIIVCSTNPAAFRSQYGLGAEVAVFGPWTGSLNNAGEAVKLTRPGDPEPDGTVSRCRVDRVRYEPWVYWPTGAGPAGTSLERLTLEGYGNDPGDNPPGAPTPGTVVGNHPPTLGVTGATTVSEGETLSLQVQASDANLPWQGVTYHPVALPAAPPTIPLPGRLRGERARRRARGRMLPSSSSATVHRAPATRPGALP